MQDLGEIVIYIIVIWAVVGAVIGILGTLIRYAIKGVKIDLTITLLKSLIRDLTNKK